MGELIYKLPKKEKLASIVRSIPLDWCWFEGHLTASEEMYKKDKIEKNKRKREQRTGEIARNKRLVISISYSIPYLIKTKIIGTDDAPYEYIKGYSKRDEDLILPSTRDINLSKLEKRFSSFRFNGGKFRSEEIARDIGVLIARLINTGYMGWIAAVSRFKDNKRYADQEKFYFTHGKTTYQQPSITLAWKEKYGGKKENLIEILNRLERLGVEEIKPRLKS